MQYCPTDYTGNKFIGTWSKLINLQNMLFYEQNEKYINKLNAQRKAELEL
jgi:Txe/YoeB family toxin of Txe-Axe toxin-antitoxin module